MDPMQPIIQEGGAELLPCATRLSDQTPIVSLPFLADNERILYSTNTPTVEKLLREAGLQVERPDLHGQVRYRDERSIVWAGPILFFSAAALAENPHLMSLALGVISNYLTDLFRGRAHSDPAAVHLDVIEELEPGKRYRRVKYDGPIEGLSKISAPIRTTYKTESEKT